MIYVSVYPNSVATEPGKAEYVKAFADGTPAEAIATELFNHAEFEKAAPCMTDAAAIHANLVSTVEMALPARIPVTINSQRRLFVEYALSPSGVQSGSL